jgi:chromosome segregation ATPase
MSSLEGMTLVQENVGQEKEKRVSGIKEILSEVIACTLKYEETSRKLDELRGMTRLRQSYDSVEELLDHMDTISSLSEEVATTNRQLMDLSSRMNHLYRQWVAMKLPFSVTICYNGYSIMAKNTDMAPYFIVKEVRNGSKG